MHQIVWILFHLKLHLASAFFHVSICPFLIASIGSHHFAGKLQSLVHAILSTTIEYTSNSKENGAKSTELNYKNQTMKQQQEKKNNQNTKPNQTQENKPN